MASFGHALHSNQLVLTRRKKTMDARRATCITTTAQTCQVHQSYLKELCFVAVCNVCGCRWRQRAQCERSFIGGCRAVMMTNEDDSDLHSIIYNTWNGHCTGWSGTMWISNYSISFHGQSQRSTKTSRYVQVEEDIIILS